MRSALSALLVLAVAGCMPSLQRGDQSDRKLGEYTYRIENKAYEPIVGSFAVLPDSILLVPEREVCKRQQDVAYDREQAFECYPPPPMTKLSIFIDANRPTAATWRAAKTYPQQQRVCIRYTVTKEGKTICAATRLETVLRDSVFSGRMVVARASAQ